MARKESEEQKAFVKWAEMNGHYCIENLTGAVFAGKGAVAWKYHQLMGAKAGIHDLILITKSGRLLWAETKCPDGVPSDISKSQREFALRLRGLQHQVYGFGCEELIRAVLDFERGADFTDPVIYRKGKVEKLFKE